MAHRFSFISANPTLGLLLLATAALASENGPSPIGPGDRREGYDQTNYVSDSVRVGDEPAAPAQLADLIKDPPLGLPRLPRELIPSSDAIALGRALFFDRRLSFNDTLSCAMCHIPEQGFAQNELATPVGIHGRSVKRNAPSLYNVGYRSALFHDGRERTLELQIWGPLLASNEMGNPSIGTILEKLTALDSYQVEFQRVFGEGVSMATLGRALASYQRALLSADSPFDRWHYNKDRTALSETALQGYYQFVESKCHACHTINERYAHFSDDQFHDTGVGHLAATTDSTVTKLQIAPGVVIDIETDAAAPRPGDLGRYEATGRTEDRWKYRTPSLRNVALTAPYMHNGSLATLAEVVAYYDGGGAPHAGQDPRIRPLELTPAQRDALVDFLESLTGSNAAALAADARMAPIGERQ